MTLPPYGRNRLLDCEAEAAQQLHTQDDHRRTCHLGQNHCVDYVALGEIKCAHLIEPSIAFRP